MVIWGFHFWLKALWLTTLALPERTSWDPILYFLRISDVSLQHPGVLWQPPNTEKRYTFDSRITTLIMLHFSPGITAPVTL